MAPSPSGGSSIDASSVRSTWVMGSGIGGLTLTGVLAAAAHPDWRATLAVVAGTVAAVVIALSLVAPRQRVALGRIADATELTVLALLLPLGVAAAGLV